MSAKQGVPYALAVVDQVAKDARLPQGHAWYASDARAAICELYEASRGPIAHSDHKTRMSAQMRLVKAQLRFEGERS